jgi:hypothetical protein
MFHSERAPVMSTLYKLTDQDGYTRRGYDNACLWAEGVSHSGTGEGDLCGPGYIHAYTHPLLAVLLNPIHADFTSPRMWEAEGEIAKLDRGLKVGCVTLTTVRELPLPVVTMEQRVRFAILCAKVVYNDPAWNAWADRWLDGTDRTVSAAREAAEAAARATLAAAWVAVRATEAAEAAALAAEVAEAAWAAAREAAWAAARAAEAARDIDLIKIAEEVVNGTAALSQEPRS